MPSTAFHTEAPRPELALSSKRHAYNYPEEERLLGATRSKNDAGAVRIGMPQTRMPAVKIPSGGPRPSNTLSATTQEQRANRIINSKLRRGHRNELHVEYSRGSNVTVMPHANGFQEGFTLPTAKRQKTKHEPSSPTSSSSVDALDTLASESVKFVPPTQSQNGTQTPSIHSQGSGHSCQMGRSASSNGSVQEYKSIERLMSSNPQSVKRQRRRNSHDQQKTICSLATPTISDPIDISGDDEMIMDIQPTAAPHLPHQRTMRNPPSTASVSDTSRLIKGLSSGKQSPFFQTSSHVGSMQKPNQSLAGDDREGRLAKKFVRIDGKRRDSDVNMSSDLDELQNGGDTVRHLATSRQCSPTKVSNPTIKLTSSNDLGRGLPESDIQPTNWAKAEPKSRSRSHTRETVARLREKSPSWAIEIAEYSHAGHVVNDCGLGLVYKDSSRVYTVMSNGKPTLVLIHPDKLQMITWGTSGCKVRFTFSKIGNVDNTVDIEFRREKDIAELVKKLHAQSRCKTKPCDSAYMDKIFERRRQDVQNYLKAVPRSLIPYNERCDASGRASCQTGSLASAGAKSHRTGTKLVDALFDRAAHDGPPEALEHVTRPTPNGLPTEKSIHEVLDELEVTRPTGLIRQQDQNSHLRRSTRASGAMTRASDDIWADLEDVPAKEKYSEIHGLGKAWNKPLTYPREGRKKTTVEFSDLERLDEGEFLNDNLISFYLRFLEQELGDRRPDVSKRVYFFNTYFYATLTNTHKGKKCFNYEGVQKWTRTVDLFTYDYIIVPINESSHWYLAIICNLPALDRNLESPGEAASSQGEIDRTAAGGTADKFALPSSSPAVSELARESPAAMLEDGKDETEARNSFADMSLDNGLDRPALDHADSGKGGRAQAIEQEVEDQDMLDAQLEDGLLGSVPPRTGNVASKTKAACLPVLTKTQIQNIQEPVRKQDDDVKASTGKSKKPKRKSATPAITKTDPNKPAIVMFDSLGLSRGPTIKTLKDYLHAEARAKRGGMSFDGGHIKGINAKVPQQTNFSDCGLYLLGYVAKFLEDDPKDFIANIIGRSYGTTTYWSKLAPSALRANIRDQVRELHRAQEEERQSARKGGKSQDKNDSKSESSPTRGPAGQAIIMGLDPVASGAESHRTSAEVSVPHPLEPGQVKLDAKLNRPDRDFDEGTAQVTLAPDAIDYDETEQAFQETDRAIEAAAAAISPPRARISPVMESEERQNGRWTPAETIVIDSESQIDLSDHKSLEPFSQDARPGGRLASEIADSQPSAPATRAHSEHPPGKSASPPRSETTKSFEKVLSGHGVRHSATRAQDTTVGEAHKVTVKIPKECSGKQHEWPRLRRSTRNNLEEDNVQVINVIDVDDL